MNINEIMNFNFNIKEFIQYPVITPTTKRKIEDSQKKLLEIIKKWKMLGFSPPPQQNIELIVEKFILSSKKGFETLKSEFNQIRELRILTWALNYKIVNDISILNSEYLEIALKLINLKWRDRFLNGLIYILIQEWNSLKNKNGNILRSFIVKKLNDYSGSREALIKLKNQYIYFNNLNGPLILGSKLLNEKKEINYALEFLGFPERYAMYDYFGDVCFSYVHTSIRNNTLTESIENILRFLEKHNNKNTNKKVLTKIILEVDNKSNLIGLKDLVKNKSFILIGDPAIDSYWIPWKDATEQEETEIKRAQRVLNEWITSECIEIFFKEISMDTDREKFWKKYAKKIPKFKIFGSKRIYNKLKLDSRINQYINYRYITTKDTSDSCALVFKFDKYTLVEFSQVGGAFYAYKNSNPKCLDVDKIDINNDTHYLNISLNNLLKDTSMPLAASANGLTLDEGRIIHGGDWQTRLKFWLEKYLNLKE